VRADAKLACWVSRFAPAPALPLRCKMMEHHPCRTQTFVPMLVSRFLVVVAQPGPDGEPDARRLRAFLGSGGQAITYRAKVRHHGMVALNDPALFVVINFKNNGPLDERFVMLSEAATVRMPPEVEGVR
jgi:ureidoglycolate lyase